mmetsp:Transcript_18236/g.31213  ORF Transcript_18236/g.31213 Transcript_18236/m.31213 type:complete len:235 (-) Transcript_18236:107-811(-)
MGTLLISVWGTLQFVGLAAEHWGCCFMHAHAVLHSAWLRTALSASCVAGCSPCLHRDVQHDVSAQYTGHGLGQDHLAVLKCCRVAVAQVPSGMVLEHDVCSDDEEQSLEYSHRRSSTRYKVAVWQQGLTSTRHAAAQHGQCEHLVKELVQRLFLFMQPHEDSFTCKGQAQKCLFGAGRQVTKPSYNSYHSTDCEAHIHLHMLPVVHMVSIEMACTRCAGLADQILKSIIMPCHL